MLSPALHAQIAAIHGYRCANCRDDSRCRARLVVPPAMGGQEVPSNGIYLCRACDFRYQRTLQSPSASTARRPIGLRVSRGFAARIERMTPALSSTVRELISVYLASERERFDDLGLYQDEDAAGVRLGPWIDPDTYEAFRARTASEGLTMSAALVGLLFLYESTTLPKEPAADV